LFEKTIESYVQEKEDIIKENSIEIENLNRTYLEQINDLQKRVKEYHR
jgi:hypothetical protein